MQMHISFTAEEVAHLGDFAVTNSLLTAILAVGILAVLFSLVRFSLNTYYPGKLELGSEAIYLGLLGLVKDILGEKNAEKFFSFVVSFFIFILAANWLGLLPIVPALGLIEPYHAEETAVSEYSEAETETETATSQAEFEYASSPLCLLTSDCLLTTHGLVKEAEFKPIFRAPTADLSSTISLALISVVVTNLIGLSALGAGYFKKYFDFRGPIEFFVGILELLSELGKIISFAFRLFGNVFAGEVLLAVITSISFGIATLPFLGLELFVGVIQALVFFVLTTVFIGLAQEHH